MCEWSQYELIRVKIPSELSYTGQKRWKDAQIDSCIAPIVEALQKAGIDMKSSCCGHGKRPGEIHLQDGRILRIFPGFNDTGG